MLSRFVILSVLCLGAAVQAAPAVVAEKVSLPAESNGLKISIAPTSSGGDFQSIVLDRSDPHINIVLQNISDKPMLVHNDLSISGAFSTMLEVTESDGRILETPIQVKRFLMGFTGPLISPDVIEAGGAIVREVRLNLPTKVFESASPNDVKDAIAHGYFYSGLPFPQGSEPRILTMRAVFQSSESKSDNGDKAETVWTGKIASPSKPYRVFWGAN